MRLLITGGVGYIGSHVAIEAIERGYNVTVFDNLSTANKKNIIKEINFIEGSLNSKNDLLKLFKKDKFDGIIHLAGLKASGDSMKNPIQYAENNIIGSLNILKACIKNGIEFFIFSSSAAVYGDPIYLPIDEFHPLKPSNYYGYTKLSVEKNLEWYSKVHDFVFGSLRYFNAAGYDLKKRIKGKERNPKNLIPLIMEIANTNSHYLPIYGTDYKTKDGTGIRDYVHVSDLAKAHIDTLEYIVKNKQNLILNLGSGSGFSVFEILEKAKKITKKNINYKILRRRDGDVAEVVASCALAREVIKWNPKFSNLDTILESTWEIYK